MDSNRSQLSYKGKDLFIHMIYALRPNKQLMLLRHHEYYKDLEDKDSNMPKGSLIPVTVKDAKTFSMIKFEYIKHIKSHVRPENRVADWEWQDDKGFPDWDKLSRLIEKRKTREEKSRELEEELRIKDLCNQFEIPYFGYLDKI